MNVYVRYDVLSMFVNEVVCDQDIVSSGKKIPVLRLLGCVLFVHCWDLDSTSHWNHRWRWLGGESQRKFIWLCHGVKKNRLDQII